jgi:peptidyl-prolyl cis-trans isomerase D
MKQFVKTANVGDIYGPSYENDKYRLFKLVDKTIGSDSVKVSHIMLSGADDATLKLRADSIIKVLKSGGDFATLAKQFSSDQAAQKGGELGWFTEATALRSLNDDFKKTIFSIPVNDYAIVKSMYGTHIVKVTDKTASVSKYKIADVDMAVSASSKTYGIIYNKLNQFVTKNNDPKDLETAAKKAGYSAFSNVTINKTDETIGNIKNSRQVIRWSFQNDKGKLSEIFECSDKFVIAAIEGKLAEGYRSLASVTPLLKAELVAQKKGEMIVKSLADKKLTTLESYAQAMKANIDSVKFVSFATPRIAGIGVEPKLNAMVSLLRPNEISAPIAGNNGVYVFRIVDQNKDLNGFDEVAELKALNSSNMYRVGYQAVQSLMDKAKVVDNRIRFY